MLPCPKCGFDNELGRIFCHQCGAKLDLDKIKPGSGPGKIIRRKSKSTTGRIVRVVIEIGAVAGIAWAVSLLGRTPEMTSAKPTNADFVSADDKRQMLDRMILQPKPSNAGAKFELSVAEIDAYLQNRDFGKPPTSGFRIEPKTLTVELDAGTVILKLRGTAKWGDSLSKEVFLSYAGVPEIRGGHFEFRPVSAAIGEMPIHPSILLHTNGFQDYFGHLFSNLADEKNLLDQLASISVTRDRVVLVYQPKHEATAPARR